MDGWQSVRCCSQGVEVNGTSRKIISSEMKSGGGKERNFVSDDEVDHKKWQQIVMILENKKS